MEKDALDIFRCLDLTSLNSTDNENSIVSLIDYALHAEKKGYNIASICTFSNFSSFVKKRLTNSSIKVCAVAGAFPHGQSFASIKKMEIERALMEGADEIDTVLNLGEFFLQNYRTVTAEIQAIKQIVQQKTLKVIIESGELKLPENIALATQLAIDGGADFVKTSTGKTAIGATTEAAKIICTVLHNHYLKTKKNIGFKVSGGVRTIEEAKKYAEIFTSTFESKTPDAKYFRIGASTLAQQIYPQQQ
jgi:deoxyribose-phosphate aldolase